LVRRVNEKLQRDAIAEGERTIAYLKQQIAKAGEVEVRIALYNLVELETKKIAVANARTEYAFKVVDPAVVPRRKTSPKRVIFLILGMFIGLVASIVVILTRLPSGVGVTGTGSSGPGVRE
jgi:LPS O-antigen subunit length determinant protein (WzzB/FepE family)